METERDTLAREMELNRNHRSAIIRLNNQILETRLNYLKTLEEYYENFWLDVGLKSFKAKMECIATKEKLLARQSMANKIEDISSKLCNEAFQLDRDIRNAEARLSKYKALDPILMAEFRQIKDDLECQELLIKMSEKNIINETWDS